MQPGRAGITAGGSSSIAPGESHCLCEELLVWVNPAEKYLTRFNPKRAPACPEPSEAATAITWATQALLTRHPGLPVAT